LSVYLTGATGFAGSNLARVFAAPDRQRELA
jgi:nucleoside-diphosphate-sugar epimerase